MMNLFRIVGSRSSALRSTVLAVSFTFVALSGSAVAADAPRAVTEQDIERVEQEWTVDESKALGSLAQLREVLEATGKVDQAKTASNVYWLSARGIYASTNDCEGAYDSLYRATALGFLEHWPSREPAHTALSSHLTACLSHDKRTELALTASTALNKSALDGVMTSRAEESGLLAKAKDDSAAGPKSMKDISDNLIASTETLMQYAGYIGSVMLVSSIAFTLFNASHGGSSSSSGSSATTGSSGAGRSGSNRTPPPPADSTDHTNAPVRDKRPSQKNHVRKGRSVMQRLTPWR